MPRRAAVPTTERSAANRSAPQLERKPPDAQRMRAQPLEAVEFEPRHAGALRQDPAHRVRMQRGLADAAGAADAAEQRTGLRAGHRLPRLESPRRAGLGVLAARQTD